MPSFKLRRKHLLVLVDLSTIYEMGCELLREPSGSGMAGTKQFGWLQLRNQTFFPFNGFREPCDQAAP